MIQRQVRTSQLRSIPALSGAAEGEWCRSGGQGHCKIAQKLQIYSSHTCASLCDLADAHSFLPWREGEDGGGVRGLGWHGKCSPRGSMWVDPWLPIYREKCKILDFPQVKRLLVGR
jgi:hypothetical protein